MKYIDLHCDTLMKAFAQGAGDLNDFPAQVNVGLLKKGDALAQFFAIFMPPPNSKITNAIADFTDEAYINGCLEIFANTIERGGLALAKNANDIKANEAAAKISAILTFEDGRPIDGRLDMLSYYYERGIRLITLTWNFENCFGYPNSPDPEIMARGLKPFGREAVQYMNELGIIIDVSHLSDGGFWDVLDISRKPVVASHSNLRSLSPHRRNLTNEMFRALAEKGGVSGINFCANFLSEDTSCNDSSVEAMSRHILRMIDIAGSEGIAIGSDFDGIGSRLETRDASEMYKLFERLAADGLNGSIIDKIAWKNAMRIISDCM